MNRDAPLVDTPYMCTIIFRRIPTSDLFALAVKSRDSMEVVFTERMDISVTAMVLLFPLV
jgi:hypothetical protein